MNMNVFTAVVVVDVIVGGIGGTILSDFVELTLDFFELVKYLVGNDDVLG
jgi:hypothetical protein